MKKISLILCLFIMLILTSCNKSNITPGDLPGGDIPNFPGGVIPGDIPGEVPSDVPGIDEVIGDDNKTFGDSLDSLGAYDGYFDNSSTDFDLKCEEGTENIYSLEGTTLLFSNITEDTIYSISGTFRGNIIIDVGDDYKFELEMTGFSLVCNSINPITVLSGDEVTLKAKKDTSNYIYDMRSQIEEDETIYKGAIYSEVDLKINGKGNLTVISENNNGIHTKDDLEVKNLTLLVACSDNALKGNDSVSIEEGNLTLISRLGDGIKTSNSDISSKGNQRGTVTINGGTHQIFCACDGIDASYNVIIDNETTNLSIYTDKYSNYSGEVTAIDSDNLYIRYTRSYYKYSIKYINSETGETIWVNPEYHSEVSGGRSKYYYYSFEKLVGYDKLQLFMYSESMSQQQTDQYVLCTEILTINTAYDTIAISGNSCGWTNYTTTIPGGGGPGGMDGGNTETKEYSTKGIKAGNLIQIINGNISIKSYDDALHSNNEDVLENGETAKGDIIIDGGDITLYTNDDGVHADGCLTINNGDINVTNSYEGLEGSNIIINNGNISIYAKDDGINAIGTTGETIIINDGYLYIYCTGDGIDSNSRTSYSGIIFNGGYSVLISISNGNSVIDSDGGYKYNGGYVVAITNRGGMSNEATRCQNFKSVGKSSSVSLTKDKYLSVDVDNVNVTFKIPTSVNANVIVLGDTSPSIEVVSSTSKDLDNNGVCWE